MRRWLGIITLAWILSSGPGVRAQAACGAAPTPQLTAGGSGIVVSGVAVNVRQQPTRTSNRVGSYERATIVTVLEGPVCADNFYWWRVSTPETVGWIAEGGDGVYWVEPYVDPAGGGSSPFAEGLPPVAVVPITVPAQARRDLLYTAFNPDSGEIEMRIYDAQTQEIETLRADGNAFSPSWSPNGEQISFVAANRINLLDLTSAIATPLNDVAIAAQEDVLWSPGGDYIAYDEGELGTPNTDIYFVDVATGEGFNATPNTPNTRETDVHWSPDGLWLAYTSSYRSGAVTRAEVRVLNVRNGNAYRIGDYDPRSRPVFSPDGVRLAFLVFDRFSTGSLTQPASLVIADVLGGGVVAQYAGRYGYDPAWSPDGLQVVFADEASILIADAAGGGIVRSIPFQGDIYDIGWSPDRSTIAFTALPIEGADLVFERTINLYLITPDARFPMMVDRNLFNTRVLWRPPAS